MKRLKYIFMPLFLIAAAVGCDKTGEVYVSTSVKSIELSPDADDISFSVSSNVEWKMTVSDKWFKITPKRGNGETEVRLVAERNQTGMDRTSVLEFTAGTAVERLEVRQPAYVVNMKAECAESVAVKKGETFEINLTDAADDWKMESKNAGWLKEFSRSKSKVIFQLDPSVKFDENVPAVFEFTSPSDPTYYASASVKPVNWFSFKAEIPESIDLGERGAQLDINVEANFDWNYSIKDGAWLREYSRSRNHLVFDGIIANLLTAGVKAEITFTSEDYANFSYTAQVQPVAPITFQLVDRTTLKPIVLEGDSQWDAGTDQYLFDGAWTIYRNDYKTYTDGDPDKQTGISYKSFSFSMNDYKIQDRPMTFTIDAGKRIRLARFILNQYYQYEGQTPLTYDVYAWKTNGTPVGNEPLGSELLQGDEGWVKIGSVNNVGKITELSAKYKDKEYFNELAQGDIISVLEDDAFMARYYRFAMTGNGYWWYGVKASETGISSGVQSWGIPWGWLGWCTISEIRLYEYIDY